ncbi:MAG: hypothetical protein GY814_08825 [Gammaproteobacteria bacterium]|nr:hypothetical protein [Gammaproteobacteria bacterium]
MIDTMFGRRHTPKIIHRSRLPGYIMGLAVIAAIVFASLALMCREPAPILKKDTVRVQVEPLQQEIQRQILVIRQLNQQRDELLQRIVKLERMSQIDRESVSRVQDELMSDQSERLKLEEELLFLRSIVASKFGNGVLHLQRLRLQPGKSENSVLYAFTVSKVLRAPEYLEGVVNLSLSGKQNGVERTLSLGQVTRNKQDSLRLRFKYFQSVEGEFLLPDGFKPSGVTIEVKPEGKKFSPVKKSFKWVVQR